MKEHFELRIELEGEDLGLDPSTIPASTLLAMQEAGPRADPVPEIPWMQDCLGRILCARYGWDDSLWSTEQDGILIHPIYYGYGCGREVHLVKATPGPPTNCKPDWRWVSELKCHCHLMHCPRGVVHVLHVCGHDTPASLERPLLLSYAYEFQPHELEALWDVMLELRDLYRNRPKQSKENPAP